MPTGTLTRLFERRGFGFITPDDSDRDVFFSMDERQDDAQPLREGQRIEFVREDLDTGWRATAVHVLE